RVGLSIGSGPIDAGRRTTSDSWPVVGRDDSGTGSNRRVLGDPGIFSVTRLVCFLSSTIRAKSSRGFMAGHGSHIGRCDKPLLLMSATYRPLDKDAAALSL